MGGDAGRFGALEVVRKSGYPPNVLMTRLYHANPADRRMMFSWFAFFRGAQLGAAMLDDLASEVLAITGLRQGLVMSHAPASTTHPFPENEPAPALVLQLEFDTIEALEAAIAANGPLRRLSQVVSDHAVTQQAMLTRRYPVPDARLRTPAGVLPCSYLVQYPGPAADMNAWNGHYNAHHPPIMAKFPGVRAIEIYTRIDWVCGLDWPREDAMQRNKLVFDSPEALSASLTPDVMREMRADFNRFPPFEGGNVHYALETRIVAVGQ
jgi:hypothetical protein